ncbi:hypothetical protein [Rufibacter sediminis]|uniref:hypothetical protein n=1 Tax=Rufibacter sediminis TaxID=2762756 RepID=UPI00210CFB0A|nr:hypothetical protein [Rufibacter sediminis]
MYLRTYVKLFLHKSLVGDANFAAWRLFVSNDGEIDRLPFAEYYKAHYRKHLKKSKFGIAIDDLGSVALIDDMNQIITAQILPAWPVFSLQYLQSQDEG